MEQIKPCPFCGGNAKISYKWVRNVTTKTIAPPLSVMKLEGIDAWCEQHMIIKTYHYRVQVICCTCHSRGKPIFTNVDNCAPHGLQAKDLYAPYEQKAIEAWNRRVSE